MQDLDHHRIPPGGWKFYQPQTGWNAPTPTSSTFDQTVQLIIKHRRANPAIVAQHQLSLDTNAVGNELDIYTRTRLNIPLEAPKSLPPPFYGPQAAGVVADVKRAAQGTAVVVDWLLSGGKPVAQELAIKRAETCVACSQNVPGSWYTTAPAELIRATLSARPDVKLETPLDNDLKSCNVCKCLMRLKVWTPLDHILERTPPDVMAEFPPHCWIVKRDA